MYSIIHPTNETFTGSQPTEYFKFKYPLDNFQLFANFAIDKNENVIVTAHTGSGKTVPAIYAIARCLAMGKKAIYTAPIKTLSNQKFKEFSEYFPDVGILTGDIKINPTAPLLIMTAEILNNSLLQRKNDDIYDWNFNPDDVGLVVIDEIHFFNNKERGKIYENTLMNLLPTIQILGLSATISGAEEFVKWLGNLKKVPCHLISTAKRPVPLTHSIYWEDKLYKYEENELWIPNAWKDIKVEIDKYYLKNRYSNHTFHKCLDYLKSNNLLPATVFLLNRDGVEKQAKTLPSFIDDYMEISNIKKIWEINLLKYKERYQHTEQWNTVYDLVCKGIGIHHSGMIPVLKEIVEILYNQGLIKVLLATETFALGVNSPTKTVVFTNLTKFDGSGRRLLRPEEYGQMAGRAGRRGLDTFGNVIVLPFPEFITESEAKVIIRAPPQRINSKYSLDYSIILKLLNYKLDQKDESNVEEYLLINLSRSLFNIQDSKIIIELMKERIDINTNLNNLLKMSSNIIDSNKDKYTELCIINEKLKPDGFIRLDKKVEKKLLQQKKILEMDFNSNVLKIMDSWYNLTNQLDKINKEITFSEIKLKIHIHDILQYLLENKLIDEDYKLTIKGRIVSEVNECNCLLLAQIIESQYLDDLEFEQILAILSIFIADPSKEEMFINDLEITEKERIILRNITKWKEQLEDKEMKLMQNIPYTFTSDWSISLSMYEVTLNWCKNKNWFEIKHKFDNFEGNFIKNILRLSNLTRNIMSIAKMLNNIKLINKLDGYQEKIIRDIVIAESLYI